MSNDLYDLWKNNSGKITNQLGDVDNQNNKITNVKQATDDDEVPNWGQVKNLVPTEAGQWKEDGGELRPKKPQPISALDQKIISVADPTDTADVATMNFVNNAVAPFSQLKEGFFTKVEAQPLVPISLIKNIKSRSGQNFQVEGQDLVWQETPTPDVNWPLQLASSADGFYDSDFKNTGIDLTNKTYQFVWKMEIHSKNSTDFIHIWPNTTLQTYFATGVPIDQRGGSFIILPVNGVFRIGAESPTNKTKRIVQVHFWYYLHYQVMFTFSDGSVEFLPNLLKANQVNVKVNNLVYYPITSKLSYYVKQ